MKYYVVQLATGIGGSTQTSMFLTDYDAPRKCDVEGIGYFMATDGTIHYVSPANVIAIVVTPYENGAEFPTGSFTEGLPPVFFTESKFNQRSKRGLILRPDQIVSGEKNFSIALFKTTEKYSCEIRDKSMVYTPVYQGWIYSIDINNDDGNTIIAGVYVRESSLDWQEKYQENDSIFIRKGGQYRPRFGAENTEMLVADRNIAVYVVNSTYDGNQWIYEVSTRPPSEGAGGIGENIRFYIAESDIGE